MIDNQASANVMTLDFVRKHRFKIVPKRRPFELANGSIHYSIGYTVISCGFCRDQQDTRLHKFYIFKDCIEPLILGWRLLYDMGILSPPEINELREPNQEKGKSPPNIRTYLDETMIPRAEVQVHMKHSGGLRKVLAVPDKGSSVDAMSLAFALSMGYSIDRKGSSQCVLRLASGLMIRSVGTVCASFQMDTKDLRVNLFQKDFVVIANFPFDIAFGNALIHELKLFGTNLSSLEWVHMRTELPLLCPAYGNPTGILLSIIYETQADRLDE